MNWLRFLGSKLTAADRVIVFTHAAPPEMEIFETGSPVVEIRRFAQVAGGTTVSRYRAYFAFYASAIRKLARLKPDTVLYYESLSAIPGLFYKYFLHRKTRLLVHYHEYTSPAEYRESMVINYRSHLCEKRLYPHFFAISHTNAARRDLFSRDNKTIRLPAQTIWPNYPPANWLRENQPAATGGPVRFVYAGALNLETMYVKAFAEWILSQGGGATWDIFSWNCPPETRRFLDELKDGAIRFHEGVSYYRLPEILTHYDVGVILYKGHIPNYVYNAPNKLFEYWGCGLDVWFPVQMTGAIPFVSVGTYPRIVAVDFEKLDGSPVEKTSRAGLLYRPLPYTSESAAEIFFTEMTQP